MQHHWPQFHHFCYWELAWANIYTLNWREALRFDQFSWSYLVQNNICVTTSNSTYRYAKMLYQHSNWSKATYAYLAVACMCMIQKELTEEERHEKAKLAK